MKSILCIFLLIIPVSLYSQDTKKVDSLQKEIQRYELSKKDPHVYELRDSVKVKLLEDIWVIYSYSDFKKAKDYALEMRSLVEKIGFDKYLCKTIVYCGVAYDNLGDYQNALKYYGEAEKLAVETRDTSRLMDTQLDRSIVYSKIGNYAAALKDSQDALKLSEALNDYYATACVFTNIGIIFKQQARYDDALSSYEQSYNYFSRIEEKGGMSAALNNMGEVYLLKEQPDKAITILRKAMQLSEEVHENFSTAGGYLSLGKAYRMKNMLDSALVNLDKSLEMRTKMQDKNGEANSLIEIGKTYLELGNRAKSKENITKGIAIANDIGALEFSKEGYNQLAKIYSMENNFKEAFENQVLFKQVDDSLFSIGKAKEFSQLRFEYQAEKERDSLKSQYERRMTIVVAENKAKEKIRNYVIAGMIIIFILLVIAVVLRIKLEVTRKQKTLEQERTRISRDLHDDLGSGLTSIMMMSEQMKLGSKPGNTSDVTLQKIHTTSRTIVNQMGEIVWAMNSTNNSLASLLSYLREYTGNITDEAAIRLDFVAPEDVDETEVQSTIRRNIFLVVKEALNNVIKYAATEKVSIHFLREGKLWRLTIADNGKGFDPANVRKFGNGLKNMRARMEAIDGTFSLASSPGAGTEINIRFPLKS